MRKYTLFEQFRTTAVNKRDGSERAKAGQAWQVHLCRQPQHCCTAGPPLLRYAAFHNLVHAVHGTSQFFASLARFGSEMPKCAEM